MIYQKPKGTRDILGRDLNRIEIICQQARLFFTRCGYQEIRTPTFESADLFTHSIGTTTDIVEKEMYSFTHDEKTYVLRPEGTASVLRAVIENQIPLPGRFLYLANMFRKEKPQKGRYREFLQIGVELVGEARPYYDAEIIYQAVDFLKQFAPTTIVIEINSIGCPKCREEYKIILKQALKDSFTRLCADCQRRFTRNFLRIFDCKKEDCQTVYQTAPKITDHLCPDCLDHYRQVKDYLHIFSLSYQENKNLVRGLDYYIRTVFEFKAAGLGAQDTILAGGRYDRLMKDLGGEDTPCIGWAMGVERLLIALPQDQPPILPISTFMILPMNRELLPPALDLCRSLRQVGLTCLLGNPDESLKQQIKKADRLMVDFAVILGEDEIKNNYLTVRNMKYSQQKKMTRLEWEDYVKNLLPDKIK